MGFVSGLGIYTSPGKTALCSELFPLQKLRLEDQENLEVYT